MNIDTLLSGAEPDEQHQVQAPAVDAVRISRYAFEKAFRYARLILRGRIGTLEVGGLLTAPIDSQDRVAYDAFLTRDQVVSPVSYRLEPEDVRKAGQELAEQGQKVIGWWHSHGLLETFHSRTDDENQMVLLNQIAPSNYVTVREERVYGDLESELRGGEVILRSPHEPSVEFCFDAKTKDDRRIVTPAEIRVTQERNIGFAYSFVVNWHRWVRKRTPYCEVATRDLCGSCLEPQNKSVRTEYQLIDTGEYSIDDAQLINEIEERVHLPSAKKTYFLPSMFEQQRAAGKLEALMIEPDIDHTPKRDKKRKR